MEYAGCMRKFWRSHEAGARNEEAEKRWEQHDTLQPCLDWAEKRWAENPILTSQPLDTNTVRREMAATERDRMHQMNETGAYKIMEMIGRSACRGQWNNELSVACYRAAVQLRVTLQPVEAEVLEELYSRITTSRDEDNVRAVMDTWASLQQYRKQWLAKQLRHTGTHMLTHKEVTEVTDSYKWDVIWYDFTEQQKDKKWQSTADAILHKTSGWTYAAKAVLQYGLPELQSSESARGATEQINALGDFVRDLAQWLQNFASQLVDYRNSPQYKRARAVSGTPIETWGLTSACPQASRSSTFFGTTEQAHGTASEPRRVV